MLELFADTVHVIQVEWQALTAAASILAGAFIGAAKIVAAQLAKNSDATSKRHEENRSDAKEARDENRALSQAILTIQGKTVETLSELQVEIERMVLRLDRLEGVAAGSKSHKPISG